MATTSPLTSRLAGFGTTIFAEMSALAASTGAINLGQGFPDTDGPAEVLEAAVDAMRAGHNQYPPGPGIPALREAIAAHQRRFHGIEVDPDGEVLVTTGATEAIAAAMLALCEPGDEVVTFEPYYDSYAACIALAGAERRPVTLRPPDYAIDPDALARAFSPRTRLVLLNSPHNPTGKVFTRAELELIAGHCRERDVLVVTDEVYEHLVFDGREHMPLATLPGMAERTLTISSAGKTFSFTGWKIGWACGPRAARRRRPDRQAVPDVRQRRAVPARDRVRAGAAGRLLRVLPRRPGGQARPALRRARGGGTRRDPPGRHLLRLRRHPRDRGAGRPRVLHRACRSAPAWSRSPRSSSTTTRRPAARSSGSRSASATR